MSERELSPQGYIITKDPTNTNPFWENEEYDPNASLPSGGTAGQVLTKVDATNFNAQWQDLPTRVTPAQLQSTKTELEAEITQAQTEVQQNVDTLAEQVEGLNIPDITNLTASVNALTAGLRSETIARETADSAINARIDALAIPDISGISAQVVENTTDIASNTNRITNLTQTVEDDYGALSSDIATEQSARATADSVLQANIDSIHEVPASGDVGQVLTKTETGYEWADSTGGSTVSVQQTLTSGTEIGGVTVDGVQTKLYAPSGGGGGSTVTVTPILTSGTKVAEITVDGEQSDIYAPSGGGGGSTVTVQQTLTSGTEIGGITVDGVQTKLYAPSGSGGGGVSETLLASYGSLTPALSGGTSANSFTLAFASGVTWTNELAKYPLLKLVFNSSATGGISGFTGRVVANPFYGLATTNYQYCFWIFDISAVLRANFKLTTSGATCQIINTSGSLTNTTCVGCAIYGIK